LGIRITSWQLTPDVVAIHVDSHTLAPVDSHSYPGRLKLGISTPTVAFMADGEGDRHRTPRIVVSMPSDLWKTFGKLVGSRNRSELLRQFVAWYVREPGAKLPERPPRTSGEPGSASTPVRRPRMPAGRSTLR